MSTLLIGWEYLTGYSVATDPSTRDRPEWPPHPARVFMALAAALFETDPVESDDHARREWLEERDALRSLEALPEPELILPEVDAGAARSNVTYYVPVNDSAGPHSATIQSCPSLARSRQPRTFPRTWIGEHPCFLRWGDAEAVSPHRPALDRLCRKVTRLGHSSSLVRMFVQEEGEGSVVTHRRFVVDDFATEVQVRAITKGMLPMLVDRFGGEARSKRDELDERIAELERSRKSLTGKGARERKAELELELSQLKSERDSIKPRPPARPSIGIWSGYRPADGDSRPIDVDHSHFDTDLLILTQEKPRLLEATSTIRATTALRGAILSRFGSEPIPDWITGHASDGQPLRNGEGHLALIPLPFTEHEHADGHLLGLGIVFPRSIPREERGRALGRLLLNSDQSPATVTLKFGGLRDCRLRLKDWSDRERALQAETWTGSLSGSVSWASITPIVLDRFPKSNRNNPTERLDWEVEVRSIIIESCRRVGLPSPKEIEVGTTCWHRGIPRAVAKRRPLRSEGAGRVENGATLGDGYPPYPSRGVNSSRPQLHVKLTFTRPVVGPVLLGSGRFLGYGLCKPLDWKGGHE